MSSSIRRLLFRDGRGGTQLLLSSQLGGNCPPRCARGPPCPARSSSSCSSSSSWSHLNRHRRWAPPLADGPLRWHPIRQPPPRYSSSSFSATPPGGTGGAAGWFSHHTTPHRRTCGNQPHRRRAFTAPSPATFATTAPTATASWPQPHSSSTPSSPAAAAGRSWFHSSATSPSSEKDGSATGASAEAGAEDEAQPGREDAPPDIPSSQSSSSSSPSSAAPAAPAAPPSPDASSPDDEAGTAAAAITDAAADAADAPTDGGDAVPLPGGAAPDQAKDVASAAGADGPEATAAAAVDAAVATSAAASATDVEYAFPPVPPLSPASAARVDAIFDEILWLDMIEVHLLTQLVNERMGVGWEEAERGVMSGGGFGGGPGGAKAPTASEEAVVEEAKTIFDLRLVGFDAKAKIKVIKEVRAIAGLGLKEAKELVEAAPKVVQKGLKQDKAEELKALLEAAGAVVEIV